MHTTRIGNYHVIHNGDWGGIIQLSHVERDDLCTKIYAADLLQIAAEIVRDRRTQELEQAEDHELLGLPKTMLVPLGDIT